MTIRFQCVSCNQPIEVDDEWTGKLVACPYCRNTVTAPEESTLTAESQVHTAMPVMDQATDSTMIPPSYEDVAPRNVPPGSAQPSRNTIAVVALGLSIATVAQLFAVTLISSQHQMELKVVEAQILELQEAGENPFMASQKATMELFGESGTPPLWIFLMGAFMITACFTWLAALVCGIIAVTKPVRRRYAIWSLAMVGTLPLFFCCGGLMG